MKYLSSLFLVLLFAAAPGLARAEPSAESLFEDAKKSMAKAEFAKALELLDQAQKTVPQPEKELLADIYYTQGILLEIRNSSPRDALISFYRALRIRPEFDAQNARERAKKLLACAAAWVKSGIEENKVVEIFLLAPEVERGECPDVSRFAREEPPPPPEQALPEVISREETKEPPPVIELQPPVIVQPQPKPTWPLWLGGAVTVSAGALATGAWVGASARADDAKEAAGARNRVLYDEAVDSAKDAELGYRVGLGVAITAAIATAAYAVYSFWPDEDAAVE